MSNAPDTIPTGVPRFAGVIEVYRAPGGHFELTVDGEPFPWMVAATPAPRTVLDEHAFPALTVTILAEAVHVTDEYAAPARRTTLADAERLGLMHPALTWCLETAAEQHRRAAPGPDGGTVCGLPGPLNVADKTLPRCGDCFPPRT